MWNLQGEALLKYKANTGHETFQPRAKLSINKTLYTMYSAKMNRFNKTVPGLVALEGSAPTRLFSELLSSNENYKYKQWRTFASKYLMHEIRNHCQLMAIYALYLFSVMFHYDQR